MQIDKVIETIYTLRLSRLEACAMLVNPKPVQEALRAQLNGDAPADIAVPPEDEGERGYSPLLPNKRTSKHVRQAMRKLRATRSNGHEPRTCAVCGKPAKKGHHHVRKFRKMEVIETNVKPELEQYDPAGEDR